MPHNPSNYTLLMAPSALFILVSATLCFKYESRIQVQMTTHTQVLDKVNTLKKKVNDLNYMLSMLGGSACAMKLKGLKLQIESLNLDLENAYTNVAYCDDMDNTMMGLKMTIIELESELSHL
jgi:hypothetical protein